MKPESREYFLHQDRHASPHSVWPNFDSWLPLAAAPRWSCPEQRAAPPQPGRSHQTDQQWGTLGMGLQHCLSGRGDPALGIWATLLDEPALLCHGICRPGAQDCRFGTKTWTEWVDFSSSIKQEKQGVRILSAQVASSRSVRVCVCVWVCVCMCVCVSVCMHVCMHAWVCLCVYVKEKESV